LIGVVKRFWLLSLIILGTKWIILWFWNENFWRLALVLLFWPWHIDVYGHEISKFSKSKLMSKWSLHWWMI
jgi:hypothetical protein